MPPIRLREEPGEPKLGWNMHVLNGHERLDFVASSYKKGKILDVGCGQGGFSIWLARRGNHVTAIDMLDSQVAQEDPTMIKFIRMNALAMSWVDKYDTILLMEIIEHIVKTDLLLYLCMRALKPKGKLLITTPWVDDWDGEPDHVWRFDKESMKEILEKLRMAKNISVYKDSIFIYAVVTK